MLTVDTLNTGNILPNSTAAPALVAHQKELEKHMRADSLNEKIAHRPKPEELVKEGILERTFGLLGEMSSLRLLTPMNVK